MRLAVLIALCLGPLVGRAEAQRTEIDAGLDRDRIYVGEQAVYKVLLRFDRELGQPPSPPTVAPVEGLVVEFVDQNASRRFMSINGRKTNSVDYVYYYRVTPRAQGVYTIPGATVDVDGETLRAPESRLDVRAPDSQEHALLELSVSPDTVYPMQTFTVTLRVALKALPGEHANRDPLLSRRERGQFVLALRMPWVDELPSGLEGLQEWADWIQPYNDSNRGFEVNAIPLRRITPFFENPRALFRPEPLKQERTSPSGEKKDYWVYEFTRDLRARSPGRYRLGPAVLEGHVVANVVRNRAEWERIFAVSPEVDVAVRDVPEEGRPSTYFGAIGRYRISADLMPQRVKVGDPMTLTLTVAGDGSLDGALAPDLASRSELADDFRVYEATEESRGGWRIYTYGLRPTRTDITEFPSLELATFDVDSGRYVTLRTDPIPLTVEAAVVLSPGDIVSGSTSNRASPNDPEAQQGGVFANIVDPDRLRHDPVRWSRWLAGLGGLILFTGIVGTATTQWRRRHDDPAAIRRRAAGGRARQRLREAEEQHQRGDPLAASERLRAAITGLVADATDRPEAGLTPRDVGELLEGLETEPDTVREVVSLLDRLDGARYGASRDDLQTTAREGLSLGARLLEVVKSGGRLR